MIIEVKEEAHGRKIYRKRPMLNAAAKLEIVITIIVVAQCIAACLK